MADDEENADVGSDSEPDPSGLSTPTNYAKLIGGGLAGMVPIVGPALQQNLQVSALQQLANRNKPNEIGTRMQGKNQDPAALGVADRLRILAQRKDPGQLNLPDLGPATAGKGDNPLQDLPADVQRRGNKTRDTWIQDTNDATGDLTAAMETTGGPLAQSLAKEKAMAQIVQNAGLGAQQAEQKTTQLAADKARILAEQQQLIKDWATVDHSWMTPSEMKDLQDRRQSPNTSADEKAKIDAQIKQAQGDPTAGTGGMTILATILGGLLKNGGIVGSVINGYIQNKVQSRIRQAESNDAHFNAARKQLMDFRKAFGDEEQVNAAIELTETSKFIKQGDMLALQYPDAKSQAKWNEAKAGIMQRMADNVATMNQATDGRVDQAQIHKMEAQKIANSAQPWIGPGEQQQMLENSGHAYMTQQPIHDEKARTLISETSAQANEAIGKVSSLLSKMDEITKESNIAKKDVLIKQYAQDVIGFSANYLHSKGLRWSTGTADMLKGLVPNIKETAALAPDAAAKWVVQTFTKPQLENLRKMMYDDAQHHEAGYGGGYYPQLYFNKLGIQLPDDYQSPPNLFR